jgi:hypothetical protein
VTIAGFGTAYWAKAVLRAARGADPQAAVEAVLARLIAEVRYSEASAFAQFAGSRLHLRDDEIREAKSLRPSLRVHHHRRGR